LVDPQAAATGFRLGPQYAQLGSCYHRPIAANLLTGLVTDTLGFRNPTPLPKFAPGLPIESSWAQI